MNPKVSIIVPVYNKRSSVDACIRSILAQDYQDFELIIIDDGSTDGSETVCDCYAVDNPERIRVIHKSNGGVSAARNAGLEKALGVYICFVDADDTINCNFLSSLLDVADDYDIITCSIDCDKEWRGTAIAEYVDTEGRTMLGTAVWGKLYKHALIDESEVRFDENTRFGEDTLFNLSLWAHTQSIKSIQANLYNYTVDSSRRYELSAQEIYLKIAHLRLAYSKIDLMFGSKLSLSRDINITISLYPLVEIFRNYNEYRELYWHYYPNATDEEFLNDVRCSPILRSITEASVVLSQSGFKGLKNLYKLVVGNFSSIIPTIKAPFRSHRIILLLLRNGLPFIAALYVYIMNKYLKIIWTKSRHIINPKRL